MDGRLGTLDRLYREHATHLLRLAVVLTGDRTLAEDLVQEAFVRFHRSGGSRAGSELAYLRRTVINLSHGHHRRLAIVRRHSEPPPDSEPAAEVTVARREAGSRVVAAIRALPARQRDCIVLRFYADLKDTEIADALGISPGSVKTHLHRARGALASSLEALR
jgi:RNA polymerase sigma-70 factor (sigma-E family)